MELAFERRGKGSPLILVVGIGHHWQAWLAGAGPPRRLPRVIALDLPGFGVSPRCPMHVPYTRGVARRRGRVVLPRLGVRDPHVAGNSLGGYVALELAPAAWSAATALSPAGSGPGPSSVLPGGAEADAAGRGAGPAAESRSIWIARSPRGRALSAGRSWWPIPRGCPSTALDRRRAARLWALVRPPGRWRRRRVMPPSPPKCPITIAWGEHNRLLPAARPSAPPGGRATGSNCSRAAVTSR